MRNDGGGPGMRGGRDRTDRSGRGLTAGRGLPAAFRGAALMIMATLALPGCLVSEPRPAPRTTETAALPPTGLAVDPSIADDVGWLRPASLRSPAPARVPLITEIMPKAEKIVVEKGRRQLTLIRSGKPWKKYQVALGFSPVGHKKREGDGRTPEGNYTISFKNENSRFFRSLKISYPGPQDVAWADKMQVDPGGDIFIHGLPNRDGQNIGALHPYKDWTWGCIAVTNEEILELWSHVDEGTPIEIFP